MFRSEVITYRADRLSGSVVIATPIRWQIIGYLIFGAVAALIAFLMSTSYGRVVTVTGAIVPDKGIVSVNATRVGTITDLFVTDGQEVQIGTKLAAIRAEEDTADGRSTSSRVEDAIARENIDLLAQTNALSTSASAQEQQLTAQRAGLKSEIAQIESQIDLERALVASAQKDLDRARSISDQGFISGRDMQQREETVLARKQQLSQLQQILASKQSSLAEADRNSVQLAAQANAQAASVAASRAQLDQLAATTRGGRSYVLRASVAGAVTARTARVGQPASPQTPLMAIVPARSILQAQLAVPGTAIGFVKTGMEVSLAIDAFPYAKFGTIKGRILTVATTAVGAPGPNGTTVSVYPVTVALVQSGIAAYGKQERLVSGMSLTARVIAERQSLLEWLFDPLFAVKKR